MSRRPPVYISPVTGNPHSVLVTLSYVHEQDQFVLLSRRPVDEEMYPDPRWSFPEGAVLKSDANSEAEVVNYEAVAARVLFEKTGLTVKADTFEEVAAFSFGFQDAVQAYVLHCDLGHLNADAIATLTETMSSSLDGQLEWAPLDLLKGTSYKTAPISPHLGMTIKAIDTVPTHKNFLGRSEWVAMTVTREIKGKPCLLVSFNGQEYSLLETPLLQHEVEAHGDPIPDGIAVATTLFFEATGRTGRKSINLRDKEAQIQKAIEVEVEVERETRGVQVFSIPSTQFTKAERESLSARVPSGECLLFLPVSELQAESYHGYVVSPSLRAAAHQIDLQRPSPSEKFDDALKDFPITDAGLLDAVCKNDLLAVRRLLAVGLNPNVRGTLYKRPYALQIAASHGYVDCVKALLAAGAAVNVIYDGVVTSLNLALSHGHVGCVNALLEAKADTISEYKMRRTLFHAAAEGGSADCIRALLAEDLEGVNQCEDSGRAPLYIVASKGHADCVRVLLEAGAEVNTGTNRSWTPLHAAASGGHADCVRVLLEADAEVNAKDNERRTPLHAAVSEGHADCVHVLLEAGAEVKTKAKKRRMPLAFVVDDDGSSSDSDEEGSGSPADCVFLLLNHSVLDEAQFKVRGRDQHDSSNIQALIRVYIYLKEMLKESNKIPEPSSPSLFHDGSSSSDFSLSQLSESNREFVREKILGSEFVPEEIKILLRSILEEEKAQASDYSSLS